MSSGELVTVITSIIQAGGLATFFWFFIRGLQKQIASLNQTIDAQQKTLEVMEKRISETQKIGDIYRDFLEDIPKQLENYKKMADKLRDLKDENIKELEQANKAKDEELKKLSQSRLKEIESLERLIEQSHNVTQRRTTLIAGPQELIVEVAKYGAKGEYKDVSEALRSKVINGKLDTVVSNQLAGADPIVGVVKELVVVYSYNGHRNKKTVREGQILSLP